MTVYYTQQDFYSNGNQKITAFKPVSALLPIGLHPLLYVLNTSCPGLPYDDRRPEDKQRRPEQRPEGS